MEHTYFLPAGSMIVRSGGLHSFTRSYISPGREGGKSTRKNKNKKNKWAAGLELSSFLDSASVLFCLDDDMLTGIYDPTKLRGFGVNLGEVGVE